MAHNISSPSSTTQSSPPISIIGLNTHKSGMEGLDSDKINQIILDASKGSKYYQNEVKKDQQIEKRVQCMLGNLQKLTTTQKELSMKAMDKEANLMEMSRDISRIIVHVDMDAFYASVETRDNPALNDCPMAVGSNSMLCTSIYIARRFGVRAAIPGFIAKKLCPGLTIVTPNFDKYQRVSEEVKAVFLQYDPNFCPMGLDEAYLDLTEYVQTKIEDNETTIGSSREAKGGETLDINPEIFRSENQELSSLFGLTYSHWLCAEHVVEEIRAQIYRRTGLTASAGIAPNKMLAKIASDMNKPNGQLLVEPTREEILKFMYNLPIRKISGIGKVTERLLKALGITDCHQLYENRNIIHLLFSKSTSHFFLSISLGISSTEIQRVGERKSISTERSFREIGDPKEHMIKCKELCQNLSKNMEKEKIRGRTVTLKLKTVDFEVKSRGVTLLEPVSRYEQLYQIVSGLLQHEITACTPLPLRLRLMGIRVSILCLSDCENNQGTLKSFLKSSSCKPNSDIINQPASINTKSMCPICGQKVSTDDNLILNQHIDECLNSTAIKEACSEDNSGSRKRLKLDYYKETESTQ